MRGGDWKATIHPCCHPWASEAQQNKLARASFILLTGLVNVWNCFPKLALVNFLKIDFNLKFIFEHSFEVLFNKINKEVEEKYVFFVIVYCVRP